MFAGCKLGLSQSSVSRIWRAFGLKPHLVETWELSSDPEFSAKVRDVVGLYMNPPEHALVLAVDEKSQIQALDRTAPCLPILPTTPARIIGPGRLGSCPQNGLAGRALPAGSCDGEDACRDRAGC